MQREKETNLIEYIVSRLEPVSITKISKIVFLIDYFHAKRYGKQYTRYIYHQYFLGPFDSNIYKDLQYSELAGNIMVSTKSFCEDGKIVKKIHFLYIGDNNIFLDEDIKTIADEVISQFKEKNIDEILEYIFSLEEVKNAEFSDIIKMTNEGYDNISPSLK